jgi:hypothetical protein
METVECCNALATFLCFQKFDDELRAQEPDIDRMTYAAEEILMSCHRSAERFVRYHMTAMQTRWQQVIEITWLD